jgi:uncharacterized protein YjbI with pentapeptide repeats
MIRRHIVEGYIIGPGADFRGANLRETNLTDTILEEEQK